MSIVISRRFRRITMSLSYEELEGKKQEYERKIDEIEKKKEQVTAKFKDLVKEHVKPIQEQMQPSLDGINALQEKAKKKIKKDSPTDKEILKKLNIFDKKKLKKYAEKIEPFQKQIEEIVKAYTEGLEAKLEPLDDEIEKIEIEYKKPLDEFKRLSELKKLTSDQDALMAMINQFSQNLISGQQSNAFLEKLQNDWSLLEQAMQHIENGPNAKIDLSVIEQSLSKLHKQMQRQSEDLTLDIEMYSQDALMYPVGSNERRNLEKMAGDMKNRLEVLKKISPKLDSCIQNVAKKEEAVSVHTKSVPALNSTQRISMTTQLKNKEKGGWVQRNIDRIEEQMKKQNEVKAPPQKPARKQ